MIGYFIRFFPFFLILHETAIYLSNDMYLPGMTHIASEMGNVGLVQNTITAWMIGSGSLQFIMGPISDNWGRRPTMILGCIIFIITSMICAYTSNIYVLLIARFFQGSVAGVIYVAGHAIVHELYGDKPSIRIFSLMSMITVIAPAAGPLLGAWMLQYGDWRDVFIFLSGFGILNLVFLTLSTPETCKFNSSFNIESILQDYKKVVANRNFLKLSVIFSTLTMNFAIWNISSPFIIMDSLGYNEMEFGLLQCFVFGSFLLGAVFVRILIKNHTLFFAAGAGILMCFVGNLIFVIIAYYTTNLVLIVCPIMIFGFGSALAMSPINRLAIRSSDVAMGKKIAMLSTTLGIFCGVLGFMAAIFNNENFFNLSILYFACGLLSLVIYFRNLSSFKKSVIIT